MSSNEEFVRRAYDLAEQKDIPGWIDCFSPDGLFTDNSVGITYRAPDELQTPSKTTVGRSPTCIESSTTSGQWATPS